MVAFDDPRRPGDDAETKRVMDATVASTEKLDAAHDDFIVEQFGDGSSEEDFQKIFQADLAKAGTLSLPLTLVILLVAFGTLLAAGIPLLLAVSAVVATFGLIGPISQIVPVEESIKHVVLLIGLAVGVDYSLFYVRRMKEELAAGRDKDAALEAAAATSGHAVLVSGLTVMTAMAGMYLADSSIFTSFATGTILVVAVAMLGSLTVLPAVLSRVGHRLGRGHIPGLTRLKARVARIGIWSSIIDRVLRRPLAVRRAGGRRAGRPGDPGDADDTVSPALADSLPQDEAGRADVQPRQGRVPGGDVGACRSSSRAKDVTAPAVAARHRGPRPRAAQAHEDLFPATSTPSVDISPDKTVATIDLEIAGDGEDAASDRALDVLARPVVPETIGGVDGREGVRRRSDGPGPRLQRRR